jgi:hypothetical protein
LPVDQLHGIRHFTGLGLHRHAIAEEGIDRLVVVIEVAVRV